MQLTIGRIAHILFLTLFAAGLTFAQIDHASHAGHNKTTVSSKTGILILAHGGDKNWNAQVEKVADALRKTNPVEVAFGMATKRTIQRGIDALIADGVEEIVAVPLFVSSNSTVITSTEFLLGVRAEAPAALAVFAKMDHGSHGGGDAAHASHTTGAVDLDPMTPVKSKVPIKMTSALNAHPVVADILLSRAQEISKTPANEVVILVAHGPVSDETNRLWLNDMAKLADMINVKSNFARIDYLTVRDDAPEPIRSQATAELRAVVQKALDEKRSVLVVPVLLSYGGIEKGIRNRLEGLDYTMSLHAILPDERLADWMRESVQAAAKK